VHCPVRSSRSRGPTARGLKERDEVGSERTPERVPELGKRSDFHNEWTLRDGLQTLSTSRKPLHHKGQSRSSALPSAAKPPRFDPPTTTPRYLEKKRDGIRTLPNGASPPPRSTTSSRPTGPAPPSANSPSSSASTAPPWPATSTATGSLATANRRHGTTRSSSKQPSSTQPDWRWLTSPTSLGSTHKPSKTGSGAQVFLCDPDEAGHRHLTPNRSGAEHYRSREKGRSAAQQHRRLPDSRADVIGGRRRASCRISDGFEGADASRLPGARYARLPSGDVGGVESVAKGPSACAVVGVGSAGVLRCEARVRIEELLADGPEDVVRRLLLRHGVV